MFLLIKLPLSGRGIHGLFFPTNCKLMQCLISLLEGGELTSGGIDFGGFGPGFFLMQPLETPVLHHLFIHGSEE